MYDYREAIKEDIREYIKSEWNADLDYDELYEALWVEDSVTGNASGSYTFSRWKANENLAHNWDLIVECANEFGYKPIISMDWQYGAEWWDVSIRCYLLGECLTDVLEELEAEDDGNPYAGEPNEDMLYERYRANREILEMEGRQ